MGFSIRYCLTFFLVAVFLGSMINLSAAQDCPATCGETCKVTGNCPPPALPGLDCETCFNPPGNVALCGTPLCIRPTTTTTSTTTAGTGTTTAGTGSSTMMTTTSGSAATTALVAVVLALFACPAAF